MQQAGIFWLIQGKAHLVTLLFLGIGGFCFSNYWRQISNAIIGAFGANAMPIGVLSVLIQISVLLIGGVISAGIGLLIGLACVRLKAWYLAMVTFGFSVIALHLSSQFDSFTNGINGFAPQYLCQEVTHSTF